jgi:serine/threonine protein kinase
MLDGHNSNSKRSARMDTVMVDGKKYLVIKVWDTNASIEPNSTKSDSTESADIESKLVACYAIDDSKRLGAGIQGTVYEAFELKREQDKNGDWAYSRVNKDNNLAVKVIAPKVIKYREQKYAILGGASDGTILALCPTQQRGINIPNKNKQRQFNYLRASGFSIRRDTSGDVKFCYDGISEMNEYDFFYKLVGPSTGIDKIDMDKDKYYHRYKMIMGSSIDNCALNEVKNMKVLHKRAGLFMGESIMGMAYIIMNKVHGRPFYYAKKTIGGNYVGSPFDEMKKFSFKDRVVVALQLVEAFFNMYSNCVSHRDLSGHNILVDVKSQKIKGDGRKEINVEVIDFGMSAKIKNPHEYITFDVQPNVLAPPEIMKKEDMKDGEYNKSSLFYDIYGLAQDILVVFDANPSEFYTTNDPRTAVCLDLKNIKRDKFPKILSGIDVYNSLISFLVWMRNKNPENRPVGEDVMRFFLELDALMKTMDVKEKEQKNKQIEGEIKEKKITAIEEDQYKLVAKLVLRAYRAFNQKEINIKACYDSGALENVKNVNQDNLKKLFMELAKLGCEDNMRLTQEEVNENEPIVKECEGRVMSILQKYRNDIAALGTKDEPKQISKYQQRLLSIKTDLNILKDKLADAHKDLKNLKGKEGKALKGHQPLTKLHEGEVQKFEENVLQVAGFYSELKSIVDVKSREESDVESQLERYEQRIKLCNKMLHNDEINYIAKQNQPSSAQLKRILQGLDCNRFHVNYLCSALVQRINKGIKQQDVETSAKLPTPMRYVLDLFPQDIWERWEKLSSGKGSVDDKTEEASRALLLQSVLKFIKRYECIQELRERFSIASPELVDPEKGALSLHDIEKRKEWWRRFLADTSSVGDMLNKEIKEVNGNKNTEFKGAISALTEHFCMLQEEVLDVQSEYEKKGIIFSANEDKSNMQDNDSKMKSFLELHVLNK